MIGLPLDDGKKAYFVSDVHLGVPNQAASREREKKLLTWLDTIAPTAQHLFVVGDLFDFWYEYRYVVPKGYVRTLGKLAQLHDAGVKLYFFTGNHDMWMRTYMQEELGMAVYFEPQTFTIGSGAFYIGHGDGLGPGDHGYKFLKKIFRNPLCQWAFGMLPPAIGLGLANYFSQKSKEAAGPAEKVFLGADKEWLMIHSREVLATMHFDYFIYGHRHIPGVHALTEKSTYVNLGDWISHFTYGSWDGQSFLLNHYANAQDGQKK